MLLVKKTEKTKNILRMPERYRNFIPGKAGETKKVPTKLAIFEKFCDSLFGVAEFVKNVCSCCRILSRSPRSSRS
jgi:hypothetical protein